MQVNCFTLQYGCIEDRIRLATSPRGNPVLELGTSARPVELGIEGRHMPTITPDLELESASPHKEPGRPHCLLNRKKGDRGIVLRVLSEQLDFAYPVLVENGRLWAGAEALGGAWMQAGSSRSNTKDQLFVLQPGNRIFAVDNKGVVASITHIGKRLLMQRTSLWEFASYIEQYIIAKIYRDADNVRDLYNNVYWAARTLREMNMGPCIESIRAAWDDRRKDFGKEGEAMSLVEPQTS